jgi:protein O-mannosyl-transferase
VFLARNEMSRAEEQARTLLSMAPDDADAHNMLGVALASQGKLLEAREQFVEAVRLSPNHPQARANLARSEAGPR